MLGLKDIQSWIIFVAYMVFSVNHGLLVTASKNSNNQYNYNPATVVIVSECLKLTISSVLYVNDSNSISSMYKAISKSYKVLLLYFIPAFLYCMYNNLAFTNLAEYDPTSYSVLLQIRVVISGIMFQVLFKRKLTRIQWLSMILLTLGCMTKQLDHQQIKGQTSFSASSMFLILSQVFCSCFAGVYTEYLLKGNTSCGEVNFWIQNIFMYSNSIVCNILFILFSGNVRTALQMESVKSLYQIKVIVLICNNAAMGLVTSIFLKKLNSILKNFASALELMITPLLTWAIFGVPVTIFGILSTAVVVFAVQMYSRNPVVTTK